MIEAFNLRPLLEFWKKKSSDGVKYFEGEDGYYIFPNKKKKSSDADFILYKGERTVRID